MACCWHHEPGPRWWGDPREFEYGEIRPRRRDRAKSRADRLRDLERRQRELERELADLRERVRAATS